MSFPYMIFSRMMTIVLYLIDCERKECDCNNSLNVYLCMPLLKATKSCLIDMIHVII